MTDTQPSPFLEEERKNTDDSLGAERHKTNESLVQAIVKTERQTDKVVQGERRRVDQATTSSRAEADSSRDIERKANSYDLDDEQKDADERLESERQRSDKSLEVERSQADVALEIERDVKNAIETRLLEQERELTDKNLSAERTRTDSEVYEASNLLSEEIEKHSQTKMSLTTRDEFLAIVSHDLKNPIGAASMCAGLLLEDPEFKDFSTSARGSIELIKRNVDASLRLIADLLDVERITHGKLQLKLENNSIAKIVQESVESYAQSASTKGVLLQTLLSDVSGDVICDHDRIAQVLSNLIGNALKFTPKAGIITLSVSASESEVKVSVRDTGPGIPEDKKERIFDRFAQLGVNTRTGLGLGLYISKMLIEAHGGRIWVETKIGEGSDFHFSLPARKRRDLT